jgi:DNA-binding transcriptional ArsR family regulator
MRSLVTSELASLRWRIRCELPRGQARVALGLLAVPEDPATYSEVASALGISLGTVHQHMKRIRRRRPALYADVMLERRNQLSNRHQAVVAERRRRSLLWVRRRRAAEYRKVHGVWPWQMLAGTDVVRPG